MTRMIPSLLVLLFSTALATTFPSAPAWAAEGSPDAGGEAKQAEAEGTKDVPAEPPPTPAWPPPAPARGADAPPSSSPAPAAAPAPAPSATLNAVGALMEYGRLRLQVRAQTHYEGGGYTTVTRYYGIPFTPFVAVGSTYVVSEPVSQYKVWSVYQGGQRLTVPTYLDLIGSGDEATELRNRINQARIGSIVLIGVAGTGFAMSVAGGLAYFWARTFDQQRLGFGLAVGGGVTALLAVAGSFGAAGESRRLRWDFTGMFDGGVQDAVARHNRDLQSRLGLSAGDVRSLDTAPGLKPSR